MRFLALVMLMFAAAQTAPQDPLKVDPGHYKVEFENEQVVWSACISIRTTSPR
jgi:polyisoprenoid-binding protein YceI